MKILILTAILAVSFHAHSAQVICAPKELTTFDPHQSSGPVESYFTNLLYLPFFPEGSSRAVAKSWEQKDPSTWKIKLNTDISFQELNGWKPKANLNAEDVVYSLNRQLIAHAQTVYDEQTYNPAKLNGFEKNVKTIKANGSHEVEISLQKPVSLDELKTYLARPVGTVLPKAYAEFKKSVLVNYYPANGKMKFSKINPTNFEIAPMDPKSKDESIVYRGVRSDDLHLDAIKRLNCKRLYYAPKNLVESADKKKIKATKIRISSSLLYFTLSPSFSSAANVKSRVASGLHPDRFKSIDTKEKTNRIFGGPVKGSSALSREKLPYSDSSYVMNCNYPEIPASELEQIKNDMATGLKEALNINVQFAPLNCEQLAGFRPGAGVLGVLNMQEFFSASELISAMSCEKITRQIFGQCLPGNPDKNKIEEAIGKSGKVYPLARFENYLLEFY